MPVGRPKRGPCKYEGPKNKRLYYRVTPTIKQIMDPQAPKTSNDILDSSVVVAKNIEYFDQNILPPVLTISPAGVPRSILPSVNLQKKNNEVILVIFFCFILLL